MAPKVEQKRLPSCAWPRFLLFASAISIGFGVVAAQQLPWQTSGSKAGTDQELASGEAVQYEYPAQVELTRGEPTPVDLHFRIREGLHINSHNPSDKSFIRTELVVAEPPGIDVETVTFPPGALFASSAFPNEKLSVYTGELVLHARIKALRAAKPVKQLLQAALHYQACDANSCFPPKEAKLAIELVTH